MKEISKPLRLCLLGAALLLPLAAQTADSPATPQPDQASTQDHAFDPDIGSIVNYQPITGRERATWYLRSTTGSAVGGSVLSAAWGTAWGTPREYPATWEHFGKRWALSMSGVVTGNAMEAGFGAMWGEDPRYHRIGGPVKQNLRAKINHILLSTVTATNRDGDRMPAYARYIGQTSSNFMQMAWRPESQSSAGDALVRTLYGFLGRMGGNAFNEFMPNIKERFQRSKTDPADTKQLRSP